ncbi:MAG TPA: hypothetical protein VFF79_14505 [Conexibacter sp.]|jgi:hypothetical protein|nr:hypothetical protein [Conexibacter sp.]
MLATVADVVLGLVLPDSTGAKLAAPTSMRATLATFGLRESRAQSRCRRRRVSGVTRQVAPVHPTTYC